MHLGMRATVKEHSVVRGHCSHVTENELSAHSSWFLLPLLRHSRCHGNATGKRKIAPDRVTSLSFAYHADKSEKEIVIGFDAVSPSMQECPPVLDKPLQTEISAVRMRVTSHNWYPVIFRAVSLWRSWREKVMVLFVCSLLQRNFRHTRSIPHARQHCTT